MGFSLLKALSHFSPSRGILRDCKTSPNNRFAALVILERLSYSNCIFKIFSSAGVNLCADGSSCFVGLVVTVAGGGGVLHCDNEEEIDR